MGLHLSTGYAYRPPAAQRAAMGHRSRRLGLRRRIQHDSLPELTKYLADLSGEDRRLLELAVGTHHYVRVHDSTLVFRQINDTQPARRGEPCQVLAKLVNITNSPVEVSSPHESSVRGGVSAAAASRDSCDGSSAPSTEQDRKFLGLSGKGALLVHKKDGTSERLYYPGAKAEDSPGMFFNVYARLDITAGSGSASAHTSDPDNSKETKLAIEVGNRYTVHTGLYFSPITSSFHQENVHTPPKIILQQHPEYLMKVEHFKTSPGHTAWSMELHDEHGQYLALQTPSPTGPSYLVMSVPTAAHPTVRLEVQNITRLST